VESIFLPRSGAISEMWRKSRVLASGRWSSVWVVGVGLRSCLIRGRRGRPVPIIKDFDEFPSLIGTFGAVRREYLRLVERWMIGRSDGFTCASPFIEAAVRGRRPGIGGRLCRLPVAISEDEHVVNRDLAARIRAADAGRPTLAYVGSMNRFYGDQIDEVIALARELRRRGSAARVRILGGGPDLGHFKAQASLQDLGDTLEFAGHVRREDLASHMEASEVLLFPFPKSPFNLSRCPTKAYHYAAANRPVVTNLTGEVAALFGSAAWYYPEHDVRAFADCCIMALAARGGYDNGIPFETLTWKSRAARFSRWLSMQGWLPEPFSTENLIPTTPAGSHR
jgi:glycosyltransferase involved in cell wall biosynthesis